MLVVECFPEHATGVDWTKIVYTNVLPLRVGNVQHQASDGEELAECFEATDAEIEGGQHHVVSTSTLAAAAETSAETQHAQEGVMVPQGRDTHHAVASSYSWAR